VRFPEQAFLDQNTIEILILAFVAGFVLFRLYATLGKRTGSERPADPQPQPQPVQGALPRDAGADASPAIPAGYAAAGEGLMAILRADPAFDIEHFMSGARAAYELIVGAFAKGDKDALRGLLAPRVYDAYAAAIDKRQQEGGRGPELVRLRTAELSSAELRGLTARIIVRFQAELAEGDDGVRDAHESWTFEREVRSNDPNWLLARVQAA
jgi:predicted lipid-binding transport protein (Tim44 family)